MADFTESEFNPDDFDTDDFVLTSQCDHLYASSYDIDVIFGNSNVQKWADVNNDQVDIDIQRRIGWALCLATSSLDDRLRSGPYPVPFTDPYANQLIDACARLAGVLLYESRGIVDTTAEGEPVHQLAPHRKMVQQFIAAVHAGRCRPGGQPSATNYPQAIREHGHRHDRNRCDPPRLI